MGDERTDDAESRRRFDELSDLIASNRTEIEALRARADAADERADVSEARADASEHHANTSDARADASEARARHDRGRLDQLEARADLDERMIAELQSDGVLSRQYAQHLKEALSSSRMIGAAIGIIMESRKVTQEVAFDTLVKASTHSNRKLRIIADEVVRTGDLSGLPSS